MKHIHADVIHAWADGAQVQVRNEWGKTWQDIGSPSFDPAFEYRVKPEEKKKVTRWLWVSLSGTTWGHSSYFRTEAEAKKHYGITPHKKLEWSATEFEE